MISPLRKDILSVAKLQILFACVGFITQIFFARFLGPTQKGVLDLFLLIPTVLASLIDLGLLSANTYFAGKQLIPIKILHSHSFIWSLLASLILLFLVLFFPSAPQRIFGVLPNNTVMISVILSGPTMYVALWSALMYGIDRAKSVYQYNVVTAIGALILYLAIAFVFDWGLNGFLYATAAIIFVKSIVALTMLNSEKTFAITLDAQALKTSLSYGIALYLGLIINTLHFRLDQFVVNFMQGSADLANYALAVRISEMVWLFDYAIINASIFRVTASSAKESVLITQRITRLIGMGVLTASLLVALVAPVAIPLIFGNDFSPTVPPLILLLPGILAWSLARVLAQFVAYQSGKPWINMKASLYAFILNMFLLFIFIPLWGIAGAAIASSISYFCNFILLARAFKKLSGATLFLTIIPTKEDFALIKSIISEQLTVYARKS